MFEENERCGVSGQARQLSVRRLMRRCRFGVRLCGGRGSGGGRLMRSGLIKKRLSAEVGEAMGLLRDVSMASLITK